MSDLVICNVCEGKFSSDSSICPHCGDPHAAKKAKAEREKSKKIYNEWINMQNCPICQKPLRSSNFTTDSKSLPPRNFKTCENGHTYYQPDSF